VTYDISRAIELFEQKKAMSVTIPDAGTPDILLPEGIPYEIEEYYPVQNNLPDTYGIGINGLPASASPERQAQAKQLKGYLFFFEQILAGYFSQLAHINDFFSANPAVRTTLFQQPLYNLPEVSDLFVDFDPSSESWKDFQADENNLYRTFLNNSLESENQFLDKRQRMLDHLLSRLGESMEDYTAMVNLQSYAVPNPGGLSLLQLQELQQQNLLATAHRLLNDKAGFYYDLPYIHQSRLQSFGLPDWKNKTLIQVTNMSGGFGWQIQDYTGTTVLRQVIPEPSEVAARLKAEVVLSLATSVDSYNTVLEAGGQLRLNISPFAGSEPLGLSILTYNTPADASIAITGIKQNLLEAWMHFSLSSLEVRLYHLLQIQVKNERRQLFSLIGEYFEIYDDAVLRKRFRLREQSGPAGNILLESATNYPGLAEVANAIQDTIRNGVLAVNYITNLPASGPFEVVLNGPDGNSIARSPNTFLTVQDAVAAADLARTLLYRYYSREGFYMLEHVLLYPVSPGDKSIVISDSANPCQPQLFPRKDTYSFQISFVFPSGYARDFSLATVIKTESRPDRFRDEEFRAYAERTIRKACPGHIMPFILWVDCALPGTPLPPDAPCFDHFETRYRRWLNAYLTDEIPETVIGPLRNDLVDIVNKIYADAT